MRVSKEHDIRKKEILDKAQTLFIRKGYSVCTINDILKAVGIAKGTFYYYFDSKEEVLDAIIMRFVDFSAGIMEKKVNSPGKNAMEKMCDISTTDYRVIPEVKEIYRQLDYSNNAEMQHRIIVKTIRKIGPIYAKLIKQGMAEGVFKTDFPDELADLVIMTSQVIFEKDILGFSKKEIEIRAVAYTRFMEVLFNVKKGAFDCVVRRYIPLKPGETPKPPKKQKK